MKLSLLTIAVLLQLISYANAVTIDFEGVPYTYHENGSGNNLGNYYLGVTFGPEAVIYDIGSYDNIHYPTHSGISVLYAGGNNFIDIIFENPVSDFSLWYTSATSSNNIPNMFEIIAYSDSTMYNTIASVAGTYNWGSISELALNYDYIMSVKISGAAYHFTVDDITYNPMIGVPEPSTFLLLGAGIFCISFLIKRVRQSTYPTPR